MKKYDIGDGWVKLRDPKHVSERQRRPIIAKATGMQTAAARAVGGGTEVSEDEILALFSFNDLVAIALIGEWSWDSPITTEGLLDLPSHTYDEVLRLTAPFLIDLMPSFEVDADPESPIVPSDE